MNNTDTPIITIDGPSASGKGTVAQLVAKQLNFHYLDSGALYRITALAALKQHINWQDENALSSMATNLNIEFKLGNIHLNQEDITEAIRTEEISRGASEVAIHPKLRAALLSLQRSFKQAPGLVADGRDMGSVVFAEANTKIFLTASAKIRAERRYKQLKEKGNNAILADILLDLQQRDARDQQRLAAPLQKTDDAMLLETDQMTVQEAVSAVLQHYQNSR